MSIQDDIIAAAKKYGVDPATMLAIAQIESKFDPNAYNKSGASGVFQFMPGTASDYGLSDPFNAAANIDAGARLARDNTAALTKVLGRAPTAGELYLAHQQGLGGAKALLTHPELSAVDALSTIMSPARAKASVLQNGGSLDMTAGQFSGNWTGKADKYAANYAGTPGTALDAINAAAPNTSRISINPTAYAPTPAGLPTMDRSGLIPGPYQPNPAGLPTMDRSGPPTALPAPKPLTITLPNGSVVIPGRPITGSDGSITTFDAQGNRTHIPPPLINIGKEMGSDTIIGGLARKYGADFMNQGKAAVQQGLNDAGTAVSQGLNTAGSAAFDIATSLPSKVSDLTGGLKGLFSFGGGAPAVPSAPPAYDWSSFYKTSTAPVATTVKPTATTTKPVNSTSSVVSGYTAGSYPSGQVAAPPSAYSSGYGSGDYGYTPIAPVAPPTVPQSYMDSYYATAGTGTGIPAVPPAAPAMPPMGTVSVPAQQPQQIYHPPAPPPAPVIPPPAGTAQGGKFQYFRTNDGSIVNNLGRITAGPQKPLTAMELYDMRQALMRQGTFGGRSGGSLGTTKFGKSANYTGQA